jgi:hypothetical protein
MAENSRIYRRKTMNDEPMKFLLSGAALIVLLVLAAYSPTVRCVLYWMLGAGGGA